MKPQRVSNYVYLQKMFKAQGSPARSINSTPAVAIIIHKLKMLSIELHSKELVWVKERN
jgi:hypothetical protein